MKNAPLQKSFLTLTHPPDGHYIHCHQVHGNNIWVVTPGNQELSSDTNADGILLYFKDWGLDWDQAQDKELRGLPPLCIKTADCLPVLVLGRKGAAVVHAGWKGIQGKILLNPVLNTIDPYYFCIGPAIQRCCYQVGPEFKNAPLANTFSAYSVVDATSLFLDLPASAKGQILNSYPHAQVTISHVCTYCSKSPVLHSYRRACHTPSTSSTPEEQKQRNYNLYYF
ncbi:MAG: polyphenol oxidase family protein [Oligoflexia bacterium]|nr:polyphenol oxidase family protein [Oligoflexia bacterium]